MPKIDLTDDVISTLSTQKNQEEFYDSSFNFGGSFGVRVSLNGRKVFFLILSSNGKRQRKTIGIFPVISLLHAKNLALSFIRALKSSESVSLDFQSRLAQNSHFTFKDLSQQFLSSYFSPSRKSSTVKEYTRIIDRELLPQLGEFQVESIAVSLIAKILDDIMFKRKAPIMANRTRAVLSSIFSYGLSRGIIKSNPLKGILPSTTSTPTLRSLSIDELRLVYKYSLSDSSIYSSIFTIILLTAQKPGDVLQMRWADIRLDSWQVKPSHNIPLSINAVDVLRSVNEISGKTDYVFSSKKNPQKHITFTRKAALIASRKLGIKWSPMDLRRGASESMIALGIRPDIVRRILNPEKQISSQAAKSYDYDSEMRKALELWGKTLSSNKLPPGIKPNERQVLKGELVKNSNHSEKNHSEKVVPLFKQD